MKVDGEGAVKADKIVVCHWANGGHWNQITVSVNALNGHENHQWDIWPAVDGVTDGQNWNRGENVYANGCETTRPGQPLPTPEPTPSESVAPSPTVTPTPTPEPTVTVTATATAVPTPTPTECEPGVNEAAVLVPIAAALVVAAMWDRWRKRNGSQEV